MRELLEVIAGSVEAEVTEASDWTIIKHRPLWRNPELGKCLYVYIPNESAASPGYRTTGSVEDAIEVWLEYVEPAEGQAQNLERDEEAELEALEVGKALKDWARGHQSFGTASFDLPTSVHRFDYSDTTYNPQSELLVRYSRTRCFAYITSEYADA